jgi:hypothetical protein
MMNAVNGHDFRKADATPVEDERNVTFYSSEVVKL